MAQLDEGRNRDRIKSAAVVASLHALLGYAFVTGLGVDIVHEVQDRLKTFDVIDEKLPPPPVTLPPPDMTKSDKDRTSDPEGSAAPANLENTPSPIVAPPPEIRLIVPPPVLAAPVAGLGTADEAGAAEIPGPGTGRGGFGTGRGSGGYGDGDGGGGGAGETPPRWRSGRLGNSDYPRGAAAQGIGGTVSVRYTVATSGHVTDCVVTGSSGSAELDNVTCRLIEQRYRYEPSRDASGRAVRSVIVEDHSWAIERSAERRPPRRD